MKKEWYLQYWFICLVFAFSIFILPAIAGIILFAMSYSKDEKIRKAIELQIDKRINEKQIEIDKLINISQLEIGKLKKENEIKIDELKNENEQARIEYERMYDEKVKDEESKVALCKRELERYKEERDKLEKEISELNKEYTIKAVSIEAYKNLKSDEVKNQLQLLSLTQKDMIKDDRALVIDDIWAKKAHAEAQKKQILRCFNAESTSIIESVTHDKAPC